MLLWAERQGPVQRRIRRHGDFSDPAAARSVTLPAFCMHLAIVTTVWWWRGTTGSDIVSTRGPLWAWRTLTVREDRNGPRFRALGAVLPAPGKPASAFKASAVSILLPTQSFGAWQPLYADHRIATFPVPWQDTAIRGWQHVGIPAAISLPKNSREPTLWDFVPGGGAD